MVERNLPGQMQFPGTGEANVGTQDKERGEAPPRLQKKVSSCIFSIKSCDDFIKDIQAGKDPHMIKVFVFMKDEESDRKETERGPSAGKLIFIGGKLHERESPVAGAYREAREETTIFFAPDFESENGIAGRNFVSSRPFRYEITNKPKSNVDRYKNPRESTMVALEAIAPNGLKGVYFPDRGINKIKSGFALDLADFERLVRKGTIKIEGRECKIIESCSFTNSFGNITMTDEDKAVRDKQLEDLLDYLQKKDRDLRRELMEKISNGNSEEIQNDETLLKFFGRMEKVFTPERAKARLKRALDEIVVQSYTKFFIDRERAGFKMPIPDHRETAPLDKAEDMRVQASVIAELLSEGNYGVDILHLLPLFSQIDTKTVETTRLFGAMVKFFQDAVSLAETDVGLKFENLKEATVNPSIDRELEKDGELADVFHKKFISLISRAFGPDEDYVEGAWAVTKRFIPNLGEEIPMERFYQVHELINEVANANIPQLVALMVSHPDNRYKFESARQILVFFKVLLGKEYYENIVKAGNVRFSSAVSAFFGPMIGYHNPGYSGKYEIRERKDQPSVVVDAKPPKSLSSVIRKSFETELKKISDIFAYSIVYLGENGAGDQSISLSDQIAKCDYMTEDFIAYLKKQYSSCSLEIENDKNTYDSVRDFINDKLDSQKIEQMSGKRTGSRADLIIRRKMNLKLTDHKGRVYRCEMAFYPFASVPGVLKDKGFMGWEEKRADDKEYVKRRAFQPMKGADGLRALYELLFPSIFYDHTLKAVYPYPYVYVDSKGVLGRIKETLGL